MTAFPPLELLHEEPGFCVASRAHLLVAVWGRDSKGADIERIGDFQREKVAHHGYVQVMSVVRAGLSLNVPPEVREAFDRLT